MSVVEKEISLDYRFNLPAVIVPVHYGGKILIIAREEGNWIVLENDSQEEFFNLLRNNSIEDALKLTSCSYDDAQWVITQLIARHFEKKVRYQKTQPIMQLYLTNSCNMTCPHCYMMAGKKAENEMTTKEIMDILNAYRKSGGRDIKMTGGEIALRNDLHKIVQYGKSIGLRIDLLTNGTIWDEKSIKQIIPYINSVQISIDGYNEEENAKIRGAGNFQKALDAVNLFVKNGATVKVAITAYYSPDISEKTDNYANFAKQLKERYKEYKFDVDIATGLLPGRYGKLSEKEDEEYRRTTLEMNNRYLGCTNTKDAAYIKRHRSGIILTNCSYGYPTIAANGDLHFCPVTLMTKPVTNIRKTPLDKIMDMCKHAHSLSETSNLEPCRTCELKAICGGDCRLNFPELQKSDVEDVIHPTRKCTEQFKADFYETMIRINEDIFH